MGVEGQVAKVALCAWVGMVAFVVLGWFVHGVDAPWPQLECPERVWGMVESGSLARGDITESPSTMDQYNCIFTNPETRPFAATSWILFGAITGFVLGAPLLRNSRHPVEGSGGG